MLSEVAALHEAFPTLSTLVGLLARVEFLVPFEGVLTGEPFPAIGALPKALALVCLASRMLPAVLPADGVCVPTSPLVLMDSGSFPSLKTLAALGESLHIYSPH